MPDNSEPRVETSRAEEPRAPAPTRELAQIQQERESYRARREKASSRSATRGFLLLALIVLLASMARAGLGRVFVSGWWRL
jgi:hypothetical protein